MVSPTLAAVRARLSPRSALASAARDAAALSRRRATEKARRDADPERFRAKARHYRKSHPAIEAARHARFQAAKKSRAIEAAVALAIRLDREARRRSKARAYNTSYQRQRRARLTADLCQTSA